MGISGLLPFLKKACRPVNIKDFNGTTVAIDAYSWLHKGAFSCAEKLVKGEKTDGYVHYCLKMLNLLLDAGVKPIMVFDGCNLPSKAITENKRRKNREKTRQKGKELLCQGKLREARECFQRCVDVTPEMAYEVIQACKKRGIDCIVAPYEADAQLAYLSNSGIAHIVITEDSDLTLFGCEKILFKMDSCGGGMLYEKAHMPKCFGGNAEKFCFEKFRYMCILSGCDYLPSLPGIGLAKACRFFSLTSNSDLQSVLSKLPSYLKMPRLEVPDEYKESFIQANNTFLYQLVFCPREKKLVPLNSYPPGVDPSDMEYAGKYLPEDIALQLALGNINVKTMEKFEVEGAVQMKNHSRNQNSRDDSMWNFDSVTDTAKSEETKAESVSFKFRTQSKVKLDLHKRIAKQLDEPKVQGTPFQDDDLLSMYLSPNKKQKIKSELSSSADIDGNVACEKPKLIRHSPFRKPLTLNDANTGNGTSNTSAEVIIRSRFFHKTESLENSQKEKASVRSSWLESIDKEYTIDSAKPMLVYPGKAVDILSEKLSSPKTGKDEMSTGNSSLLPEVRTDKENLNKQSNKFRSAGFKWSSSPKVLPEIRGPLTSENDSLKDSYKIDDNQSSIVSTPCSQGNISFDSDYFSSTPMQDSPVFADVSNSDNIYDGPFDLESTVLTDSPDPDTSSLKASSDKDRICDKLKGFWNNPRGITQVLKPVSGSGTNKSKKIRRVGLSKKFSAKSSKKEESSGKNVNIKETLLNFKFVKQSKNSVVT